MLTLLPLIYLVRFSLSLEEDYIFQSLKNVWPSDSLSNQKDISLLTNVRKSENYPYSNFNQKIKSTVNKARGRKNNNAKHKNTTSAAETKSMQDIAYKIYSAYNTKGGNGTKKNARKTRQVNSSPLLPTNIVDENAMGSAKHESGSDALKRIRRRSPRGRGNQRYWNDDYNDDLYSDNYDNYEDMKGRGKNGHDERDSSFASGNKMYNNWMSDYKNERSLRGGRRIYTVQSGNGHGEGLNRRWNEVPIAKEGRRQRRADDGGIGDELNKDVPGGSGRVESKGKNRRGGGGQMGNKMNGAGGGANWSGGNNERGSEGGGGRGQMGRKGNGRKRGGGGNSGGEMDMERGGNISGGGGMSGGRDGMSGGGGMSGGRDGMSGGGGVKSGGGRKGGKRRGGEMDTEQEGNMNGGGNLEAGGGRRGGNKRGGGNGGMNAGGNMETGIQNGTNGRRRGNGGPRGMPKTGAGGEGNVRENANNGRIQGGGEGGLPAMSGAGIHGALNTLIA